MTIHTHRDIVVYCSEADSEIKVWADSMEMINVNSSSDYWGELVFSVNVETAEALANALLEQCSLLKQKG